MSIILFVFLGGVNSGDIGINLDIDVNTDANAGYNVVDIFVRAIPDDDDILQ